MGVILLNDYSCLLYYIYLFILWMFSQDSLFNSNELLSELHDSSSTVSSWLSSYAHGVYNSIVDQCTRNVQAVSNTNL